MDLDIEGRMDGELRGIYFSIIDPEPARDLDVGALLDLANQRFRDESFEDSNDILVGLLSKNVITSYICFCVGRNHLYANRLILSGEWFDRSLAFEMPFVWTYYENARRLEYLCNMTEAAGNLITFLEGFQTESAQPDLNPVHLANLLRVAHGCFDVDMDAAVRLYRCIAGLGVRDYLCDLRLFEDLLNQKDIEAAALAFESLTSAHCLDLWGTLAHSRLLFAQGQRAQAVLRLFEAGASAPGNVAICKTIAYRLLEFKMLPEVADYLASTLVPMLGQDAHFDQEINGLRFRHVVLAGEHRQVLDFCEAPGFLAQLPNWVTVEALFTFALPGEAISRLDIEVATALADFLVTQWPYSLGTVLSLYQFFSRRRMWDKIADLETRLKDEEVFTHHEVVMRRFETLCAMSRMDDARDFYFEHYAHSELRQWEACVVLRFLAEAKMWQEAGAVFLKFVANNFYFPSGEYFLLTICRRTGLHRQVIELIDNAPTRKAPPQFKILREMLADDLVVKNGDARGDFSLSVFNQLLHKAPESAPVAGRKGGAIGFLCADKAYYLSLKTFLVSYVTNNAGTALLDWYIFLAQDVPASWRPRLVRFGAKIGLTIKVIPEEAFVTSTAIHVETYGIFTGGNTLSRAAFLRIYAAKYLYETGFYGRACYVDSDIVCQSGFADFTSLPFGDAAIMARAEEPNPEVKNAQDKHGLPDGAYFNSGVLCFDFAHPEIIGLIEYAIHLSENEQNRLMFHDQCALNIAFAGNVQYLAARYNFFLRPHRLDNGDHTTATLLHFLDKPKPWDLSYRREYRELWNTHAATVRGLMKSRDYNMIVAAANQ